MTLQDKFSRLGTDNAPGQEVRLSEAAGSALAGPAIEGRPVDFSHGDVDAFPPIPGSLEVFEEGVRAGGRQAYTEYRGDRAIREEIAERMSSFIGIPVDGDDGLIITPGTQGALFLAVASTVAKGDKVAIVQPDYFANRKLVEFLDAEVVPVRLDYENSRDRAGLDLDQLEAAFRNGARVLLFSNPNNPVGVVYSPDEIAAIATLAGRFDATVIVDQLYSRLLYPGTAYTHLMAADVDREKIVTIMGPSKTESLSGYRLGVAAGSKTIIARMEKLQAIVSLRAGGYSQAALRTWFAEPEGWMKQRIEEHQAIRDDLIEVFRTCQGVRIRPTEAGSYVFPSVPDLVLGGPDFVRALRVQAGVIVTIGTEFSPHATNSFRLNFSQDHAAAVAACERIVALVDRYRA